MNDNKKEKKFSVVKTVGYLVGSAVICIAMASLTPEVMNKVSGKISKRLAKTSNQKHEEDDDWGPVIEKKSTDEEGE